MTKKNLNLFTLIVIITSFVLFIVIYEKRSYKMAQEQMQHHALVIGKDVWDFDITSPVAYLRLAAEYDHYSQITVTLVGDVESVFLSIENDEVNKTDRLLEKIGLIRIKTLQAEIRHDNLVIGRIEAVHRNRNIYIYVIALCFLILSYVVIILFSRQVRSKHLLEHTVEERTKELVNKTNDLEFEISHRIEAEVNLKKLLSEKTILLQEVHHRVKNNMAIISSLLSLQSGYIDDKKYLDMFNTTQSRINSMALVHEMLYNSEDLAYIDIRDYIKTLTQNIASTFPGSTDIVFKVEVEDIKLDIDILIPCGLIINEILTNAYKHAFHEHDAPELIVTMKAREKENVVLTICDNGKGFTEGFDISRFKGLGLKLVDVLVGQINGILEVESTQGVRFTITFPTQIEHARHLVEND